MFFDPSDLTITHDGTPSTAQEKVTGELRGVFLAFRCGPQLWILRTRLSQELC
jgi:hypothetical protein